MEMPPWHMGHVVRKLMLAAEPEMTRGHLADRAKLRPMTVTNLLHGGKSEDETIEAVASVFGLTAFDLRAEVERSNAGRATNLLTMTPAPDLRRRLVDHDPDEVEAEQYARRIVRLKHSAQSAIYSVIRAFEEATGLLKRNHEH